MTSCGQPRSESQGRQVGTKVVFETATLIEAVRRAASLAPTKGAAFDKAAGIMVEVLAGEGDVLFRATDDVTQMTHWVKPSSIDASALETVWRLPSGPFAGVVAKLRPTGQVLLEQDGTGLNLTSGRTKARLQLMDSKSYPRWDVFDEEDLVPVENIGTAIRAVQWAAGDSSLGALDGVHLDGEYAVATNRYRVCRYPVQVPGIKEDGITVAPQSAKAISEMKGEVKFGTDGHQAFFMPDDDTQIRATVYGERFMTPKMVYGIEYSDKIHLQAPDFVRMIDLTDQITSGDRSTPSLRFYIGKQQIAVLAANDEVGQVRDILDIPGQAKHDHRVEIKVSPVELAKALQGGEGHNVTMNYNSALQYTGLGSGSKERLARVLRFDKDGGYQAWVLPATG